MPRARKISTAAGDSLSLIRTFSIAHYSAALRPAANARVLAATAASAQSSQGSSAAMSAVSTVAPPQMRSPAGASR